MDEDSILRAKDSVVEGEIDLIFKEYNYFNGFLIKGKKIILIFF